MPASLIYRACEPRRPLWSGRFGSAALRESDATGRRPETPWQALRRRRSGRVDDFNVSVQPGAVQASGLKFQRISASISLWGQRLGMRSNVSLAQAERNASSRDGAHKEPCRLLLHEPTVAHDNRLARERV